MWSAHYERIAMLCTLAACVGAPLAREDGSGQEATAAIERLHRNDAVATLSDKADELAELWDAEAIRIEPGHPPEIGRAVIHADDKRWEQSKDRPRTLCYRCEIQDLQISGDWAFEWGYFSYRDSANSKPVRGKVFRVMKRQTDGSWKFARVMGFPEKENSAAPMTHPCE